MRLTGDMMIPDVVRRFPQARGVFDRYGLRGCGGALGPVETIRFFARTHGVDEQELLRELESSTAASCESCSCPAASCPSPVQPQPRLSDAIYLPFFASAIVIALTLGATWGAYLLWQIGQAGTFTGGSILAVNAHGYAQIYGWVGLFIMGFAYQALPRLWHTELPAPHLAVAVWFLTLAGLLEGSVGMALADRSSLAAFAALSGGLIQTVAATIFAGHILVTFRLSGMKLEPYVGFIIAALTWFALSSAAGLWHTAELIAAPDADALVRQVATYQAPLRDMQIHGMALLMILGVSMRMLPALFELPPVPARRAWWSLALLTGAVIGEVGIFLSYRLSGNHVFAAFLMIPWLMILAAASMIVVPWRLWRPPPAEERSFKFVRAAYAWLFVSLLMLIMLPVYQALSHIPFSHAYYGATRHAITVGFISMMIMGIGARVVPTLAGVDTRRLGGLWVPFVLVNAGCLWRVGTQILTDWSLAGYAVVGFSGLLEVTGMAWWGAGLLLLMKRSAAGAGPAVQPPPPSPRPSMIDKDHIVADVLSWFPETQPVFDSFGFTPLRNPLLRRTLAQTVTVAQAAKLRQVALADLLAALNDRLANGVAGAGMMTASRDLPAPGSPGGAE